MIAAKAFRKGAALCAFSLGLATACGRPAEAPSGPGLEAELPADPPPIVLITASGLRTDAVGALAGSSPEEGARAGITPSLDALAAEAWWAGTAVAPTTANPAAAASLLTGLEVWKHQSLGGARNRLHGGLVPLPEALGRLGYQTRAYLGDRSLLAGRGFQQGFAAYRPLRGGGPAVGALHALETSPSFTWIHLDTSLPPYVLRPELRKLLDPTPRLPRRLGARALAPYRNPAVPLPEARARRFHELYRFNAARTDQLVGRLLAGLRASGRWDDTAVIVCSLFGTEFGEHGQIGHGLNLGRSVVEVPLIIKLPRGASPRPPAPGARPGWTRLAATLLRLAGGTPAPAAAPSLFETAPPGVVSALYGVDGSNLFSLVEGNFQLHRRVRYAEPSPAFYHLQPSAAARRELARQGRSFESTPPYSGAESGGAVEVRLERWTERGSEPAEHPEREAAMEQRLGATWHAFLDRERSPREEAALWKPPAR